MESSAFTFTLYVPGKPKVWGVFTVVPDDWKLVHSSTVLSPSQSQPYFTLSASGSVALVEYVYDIPVLPAVVPVGVLGVFGGLLVVVALAIFIDGSPYKLKSYIFALTTHPHVPQLKLFQ